MLRPGTEITEYSSIILLSIGQLEVGVKIEFYLSCRPGWTCSIVKFVKVYWDFLLEIVFIYAPLSSSPSNWMIIVSDLKKTCNLFLKAYFICSNLLDSFIWNFSYIKGKKMFTSFPLNAWLPSLECPLPGGTSRSSPPPPAGTPRICWAAYPPLYVRHSRQEQCSHASPGTALEHEYSVQPD